MKTVLELVTAALHTEGGLTEADAYRVARKLIPEPAHALIPVGRNEYVRARVLAEYNGSNASALARKYRRNRSTIWRIVRRNEPDIEETALKASNIDECLCCIE